MWNDITVDVINVECDPEESNQGGIEPGPREADFGGVVSGWRKIWVGANAQLE